MHTNHKLHVVNVIIRIVLNAAVGRWGRGRELASVVGALLVSVRGGFPCPFILILTRCRFRRHLFLL
jgi:hypothetical protein